MWKENTLVQHIAVFCRKSYHIFYIKLCVFYAGLTFREISSARASTNKVVCCHFSSDGKLLATGGHDKKVNMHVHTNVAIQSNGYCMISGVLHPNV